jgi:tetratricopeptide (TPR) repeat protein
MSFGKDYQLEKLIGFGASSLIFRALDTRCRKVGVRKKVAVKLIWDLARARDEVNRLQQTRTVFEICRLITYREAAFSVIEPLITDDQIKAGRELGLHIAVDHGQVIGVLVTELFEGYHLIGRRPLKGQKLNPDYEWPLRLDHPVTGEQVQVVEYLEPFVRDLNTNRRLDILIQLTKALAAAHSQDIVHGNLNPWNIYYLPETGRVAIADLGRDQLGIQGWHTPEHIHLREGRIEALPPETDIFLLGQWMMRLLPRDHRLATWAERCLEERPARRPSAQLLSKELELSRHQQGSKRQWLAAALALTVLLSGFMAWQQRAPFSVSETGYDRIAVLPYDGTPSGMLIAEMVNEALDATPVLEAEPFERLRRLRLSESSTSVTHPEILGKALGVRFVLTGTILEMDNGHKGWRGFLRDIEGVSRPLEARGVSYLDLSEKIATTCLEMLGAGDEKIPMVNLFSTVYQANMLYSEASQLLLEGEINGALPLFTRATQTYDPDFHWARLKISQCYLRKGDLEKSEAILGRLLEKPEVRSTPRLLFACYQHQARLSLSRLDLKDMKRALAKAEEISEKHHLDQYLGDLRLLAGKGAQRARRTDDARLAVEEAISRFRRLEHKTGIFEGLLILSSIEVDAGNLTRSGQTIAEAEMLAKELAIPSFRGRVLVYRSKRSIVDPQPAQLELIRQELFEAQEIFTRTGDQLELIYTRFLLGALYRRQENFAKARSILEEVHRKAAASGERWFEERSALYLSSMAMTMGDITDAEHLLEDLLDRGHPLPETSRYHINSRLWKIMAMQGRLEPARSILEENMTIARIRGDVREIAYTRNNLGEVLQQKGDLEGALTHYLAALQLKEDVAFAAETEWTLRNLVLAFLDRGERQKARVYLDELELRAPGAFTTRIVQAVFQYHANEAEEAAAILAECKREAEKNRRWTPSLEHLYSVMKHARDSGQHLPLPPLTGNWN